MDDDQVGFVVLNHPLRREIFKRVVQMDEPVSPSRVAGDLGKPLGNVSYHVRVLSQSGALILVDEKPVSGSLEHFYLPDNVVTALAWVREALGLPPSHEVEDA